MKSEKQNELLCVTSLGKEQNSKFEVQYLSNVCCFHINQVESLSQTIISWGPSVLADFNLAFCQTILYFS